MHDLGCKIPPTFIKCQPCEGDAASYFDSKEGVIILPSILSTGNCLLKQGPFQIDITSISPS